MNKYNKHKFRKAMYLPLLLILTSVFLLLSLIAIDLAVMQRKESLSNANKISALGVAEAGVNYYLWHLAHNDTDYTDGQPVPTTPPPYGPYTHQYYDANGNLIGNYSLLITPPPSGSTVTTIESTGTINTTHQTRTVKAVLGIPSFSQYAVVTGSEVWFGSNETTNGPVHSNIGIHFDGTNNGPVTSSSATYTPSYEFGGDGQVHNGVWGNGGPQSSWLFPVPTVNFQNITANLQQLETEAQSNGMYLPKSSQLGYYIQFQSDGTYKLATVTSYSMSTFKTTSLVSEPAPANGIIYASDNVFVSGTVHGRYTVVAATLPSSPNTYRDITAIDNLTYTAKDGTDVLGLVAQKDFLVGPLSPLNMEIDAAILAQNGRAYRPYCWNDSCGPMYNIRDNITIYGSVGSLSYWNWTWVNQYNQVISGYQTTNQSYDQHLQFAPPPSFPTTGEYSLLSWREVTSP